MELETLRKLVRQLVAEAAVTASEAHVGGLALHVARHRDMEIALYNPAVIARELTRLSRDEGEDEGLENLLDYAVQRAFLDGIVGRITLDSRGGCNGAWEVTSSAADKGYGPLLYDVAMALSPGDGIMCDRDSVSPSARRIWLHYYQHGRGVSGPVTARPLQRCGMHSSENPELNMSYTGGASTGEIEMLRGNHETFVSRAEKVMASMGYSAGATGRKLEAAAERFFDTMYKG